MIYYINTQVMQRSLHRAHVRVNRSAAGAQARVGLKRVDQLHEVIRLSGMNLIIDDSDHPLIIKVASIQSARMQVYFIDNEEYFQRKMVFRDAKKKFYKDNNLKNL